MNNEILLSICIPTYNRAHCLKNCLDSIVFQFDDENVLNQVEIVVSDNASQDNTQKLVEEYQTRFNNIKYFRNKENLGLDENIINSVLRARSKYCWYLGDDDLIKNGGLKFIIDLLQKNKIAVLTVLLKSLTDFKEAFQKKEEIKENLVSYFDSYEDFLLNGYCHGVLGIFIFNRELWLKVDRQDYEKFWAYFEIILKMMPFSNLKFAHLRYPVLFVGKDYRWRKDGTALFALINWKRMMNKLVNFGYSKNTIKKELKKNKIGGNLIMSLLRAKNYDLKCSFSNLFLIYKGFYKYPFYLFLATMIFFVPNFFIKFLGFLKKKTKHYV